MMSGPKKADVEAQLNIARAIQHKCASLLADIEEAATERILHDGDGILKQTAEIAATLRRELDAMKGDLERFVPELASVREMAAQVQQELDNARAALKTAQAQVEQANQLKRKAHQTFADGEQQYRLAEESNRRPDPHYRYKEMEWALQAKELFDQAAAELADAAHVRREAERRAVEALRRARQAHAAATDGYQHIRLTRSEAEARRRAEEEARRIAEQQRREAVLSVEQARAAWNRLADLPHDKFCPGEAASIKHDLEAAAQMLEHGRFLEATEAAHRIPAMVHRLETKVRQAQQEYERQHAEAEAELRALAAIIDSTDEELIVQWANNPHALAHARHGMDLSQQAIKAERFAEAVRQAQAARQTLAQALNTAVENKRADDQRQIVGQAVMDVLAELGFDVSFEPGSRTEPLRISGQTPDVSGRGDFDIALPLMGEVRFEVNTPDGDASCIAAVEALQSRLAERGIRWQTTDWGHATGAASAPGVKRKEQEKQQLRMKQ